MFDQTYVFDSGRAHTEYVPYEKSVNVTVNEHRAPTDESIKLVKEAHQRVLDHIVGAYTLKDCPIDMCAVVVSPFFDYYSGTSTMLIKFRLSGVMHTVKVDLKLDRWLSCDREKAGEYIFGELKKALAAYLTEQILSKANFTDVIHFIRNHT